MKWMTMIIAVALSQLSMGAWAACSGNPLPYGQLKDEFKGKTVSFDAANPTGWMATTTPDWHERHNSSGTLEEIGLGNDPMQPTKVVGSWSVAEGSKEICYTYTGDSTYCYNVYHPPGGDYEFCVAGTLKATGTID